MSFPDSSGSTFLKKNYMEISKQVNGVRGIKQDAQQIEMSQ